MARDRVFDEALKLPPEVRAALAGELLSSLDGVEVNLDREGAWAIEIRQRLEVYDRGEVTAIPEEQVVSELCSIVHGKGA